MTQTLGIIIGSLRQGSYNRIMADAFKQFIPARFDVTELAIGGLPYYNEDLDTETAPAAWQDFRQAVSAVDGVLFFTPEYNRGLPAALKNALDVGSRPRGQNVWGGKPALVVTGSPGAIGGYGANHSLRQTLTFLDMPTLQQPEAYIGNLVAHMTADQTTFAPGTLSFFKQIMDHYIAFFDQLHK